MRSRSSGSSGGAREQLLSAGPIFNYLYVPGRDPSKAVSSGGSRRIAIDSGPLVAVVQVDGPAPGTYGMRRTLRLVGGSDLIEMDFELEKAPVRAKESAHVAFPLNLADGVTRADLGEALVEPGRNQLPGSCRDFIGIHSAVDISNPTAGVSLGSLDAPLVEPGAMTNEQQDDRGTRSWRERTAGGTTLYAYLLNNYWHTNYKAYQQGPLTYRFVMRPHGAFDPVALRRFSDEQDNPLLVFPVHPAEPDLRAPFALSGDPVTLSSLRVSDDGAAIVARIFNPATKTASVIVRPATAGARVSLVTPDGPRPAADGRIAVPASATRVVRVR
jgi:alpha-mannosidase